MTRYRIDRPAPVRRYPSCDERGFQLAFAVATATGTLRLCGGCLANLRAKGERAELVNRVAA